MEIGAVSVAGGIFVTTFGLKAKVIICIIPRAAIIIHPVDCIFCYKQGINRPAFASSAYLRLPSRFFPLFLRAKSRIMSNYPANLKYSKEHEWVRVEGNEAYIGITHFAQRELGDIVYVDVASVGDELDQESVFGTVEAVKTVSDLFMPVSGKVLEFNEDLNNEPEQVNTDPYGKGWMIKIALTKPAELDGLFDSAAYEAQL